METDEVLFSCLTAVSRGCLGRKLVSGAALRTFRSVRANTNVCASSLAQLELRLILGKIF
jgi:hypothetical protein